MYRLLADRPDDAAARALAMSSGDSAPAISTDKPADAAPTGALRTLQQWASQTQRHALVAVCDRFAGLSRAGASRELRGPTGERNVYTLLPRDAVLCLAGDDADRLVQLAAVLSVGSQALWPTAAAAQRDQLPREVAERIVPVPDWMSAKVAFDAVLLHGDEAALRDINAKLARRDGPIVGVQRLAPGDTDIALERLLIERALSVNTAAAGGNASLMTIG
jgi:RHH-type proline utilization regulon transcriptional repressor/proline dehydrogenase/delta 1-pyrroline-5-carboxylate dehydrogenase